MSSKKMQEFHCDVVNEKVRICLRKKPTAGLRSADVLFVLCDQSECQHVGNNKPPCPLNLAMATFAEEIRAREEKARLRKEDSEYR
jgi:histone acetyltransferase (RNA polymerase elongator complex component)